MTQFVRAANPIWWLPDLTGLPLNDEYYAFFLTNTLPYVFQPVYQDPNGISPWAAPLQFQPAGTLPNNLYFDDTLTYRIEIRHGNTSADQLIYLIENFVPGNSTNSGNTALLTADNMITNPTFSDIYFVKQPSSSFPTFTYVQASSSNYSVPIGPGWRIDLQGAGSLTVSQQSPDGASDFPGDPNYFIQIQSSGWTSVKLIQQFNNSGAIFGHGAIAVAFTAESTGSPQTVSVQYVPSTGIPQDIFIGLIMTGGLLEYKNAVNLPASANTDTDGNAFVDIVFNLPVGSNISLTNVQIVGQSANLPATFDPPIDSPSYQQQTYERTVDREFNVYKSWLFNKRIPSVLVGWDFPLNPAQIFGNFGAVPAQAVGANKSYYAWDQTILFQSANSAIVVSSPASVDMTLTAAVTTQLAIIQYLDTDQTRKLLADAMAVNISATSTTASNNGIPCTVSLWYTTDVTLPNIASSNNNSFVLTLDVNGKPATFQPGTNWFEVKRLNQQEATFTVTNPPVGAPSEYNDYNFNQWDLEGIAAVNTATYFAIVIGTASITAADSLHMNSVGLMNGQIATRPGSQTLDEVLRECQLYFEKSFEPQTPIGGDVNSRLFFVSPLHRLGGQDGVTAQSFEILFKQIKRVSNSIVTSYAPDGTPNALNAGIQQGGAGVVVGQNYGIAGVYSVTVSKYSARFTLGVSSQTILAVANSSYNEGFMFLNYVADSRLGIV